MVYIGLQTQVFSEFIKNQKKSKALLLDLAVIPVLAKNLILETNLIPRQSVVTH